VLMIISSLVLARPSTLNRIAQGVSAFELGF
jgi:hypothetical protein